MSGQCKLMVACLVILLMLMSGPAAQAEKGWWDYLKENEGSYRDAVAAVSADMTANVDDDPLLVVRGWLRVGYARSLLSMNHLSTAIYDEFCRLVAEKFPDSLDKFLAAEATVHRGMIAMVAADFQRAQGEFDQALRRGAGREFESIARVWQSAAEALSTGQNWDYGELIPADEMQDLARGEIAYLLARFFSDDAGAAAIAPEPVDGGPLANRTLQNLFYLAVQRDDLLEAGMLYDRIDWLLPEASAAVHIDGKYPFELYRPERLELVSGLWLLEARGDVERFLGSSIGAGDYRQWAQRLLSQIMCYSGECETALELAESNQLAFARIDQAAALFCLGQRAAALDLLREHVATAGPYDLAEAAKLYVEMGELDRAKEVSRAALDQLPPDKGQYRYEHRQVLAMAFLARDQLDSAFWQIQVEHDQTGNSDFVTYDPGYLCDRALIFYRAAPKFWDFLHGMIYRMTSYEPLIKPLYFEMQGVDNAENLEG